jgi:hypothetical protein
MEPPMFAAAQTALSPEPSPLSKNPFEAARLTLIKRLLQLRAPKAYPCAPSPSDHETVADHIREVAEICDEWLAAIGAEVRDNAVTYISAGLFSGSFTGAIDGNETFACTEQAEALIEYRRGER